MRSCKQVNNISNVNVIEKNRDIFANTVINIDDYNYRVYHSELLKFVRKNYFFVFFCYYFIIKLQIFINL